MTSVLLLLLTAASVWLMVWGWRRPYGVLEFPFLAGAASVGFVVPQALGAMNAKDLPAGSLDRFLLVAITCTLACGLGYRRTQAGFERFSDWKFGSRNASRAAFALFAFGSYFFFALRELPTDLLETSQWTGLPVAYLFLAECAAYGFVIALIVFLRERSLLAAIVAGAGSLAYLDAIVLAGRRKIASEFVLVLLCAFFLFRERKPPRWLIMSGIVLGTLFIHSTGDYRSRIVRTDFFSTLERSRDIEYVENFKRLLTEGGAEVRHAIFSIHAVAESGNYDLGIFHWNQSVFNYVPAQLVGRDLKDALLIPLETERLGKYGYAPPAGATYTGFTDAFRSFWYFGFIKFLLIGYLMRRCFESARRGSLVWQLAYAIMLTHSLHAITHHTHRFFSPWLHLAMFALPVLYFARTRPRVVASAPGRIPRRQGRRAPLPPRGPVVSGTGPSSA